jgi:SAM-dependent methyltransferase
VIPDPTGPERARLPATFDRAAEDYERTRPVCPPELFDDLVAVTGLSPGDRVVEIGPGTGQATVPLAGRGLAITGVEPGAALAAIARRRLAALPHARVDTATFEAWEPDGAPIDAVVAVNSLHWVDPAVRYRKPAALLRDGGHLVVVGTKWATAPDAERFWADVQDDYRAVGFPGGPPPLPDLIEPWHLPPEAGAHFSEVAARRYPPFSRVYTAEEYLANLGTQSGPAQLGEERRAEFLERVRRRLAAWPRLTATFVALLTVGRHSGM